MKPNIFITDDEIIKLYKNGYSQKDILNQNRVSITRIRSILRENSFDTSSYKKIDKTLIKLIKVLINKGYYQREIAAILDCSTSTVRSVIKQFHLVGVSPSKRKANKEKRIITLFYQGISKKCICEITKAQASYINKVLRHNNLIKDKITIQKEVINLYNSNMSISQICRETNLCYRTIKKIINEYRGDENDVR